MLRNLEGSHNSMVVPADSRIHALSTSRVHTLSPKLWSQQICQQALQHTNQGR